MQRAAPPKQSRNKSRGGRQNSHKNTNDERQEQHLRKQTLSLPVSTRALGLAVGRFMSDAWSIIRQNLSSGEDDWNEAYIERQLPNLYQIYRLFLAVFEEGLYRAHRNSWPRDHGYSCRFAGLCFASNAIPKHITEIVNALGVIKHGDHTFVPVVAKEVYDANGKLVPQPLSLLYTNLRKTVVALADPETPEQYRIDFEAFCPIPGAIWDNHLLKNADEIMPNNHTIKNDEIAFLYLPASLLGKLNDNTAGQISALVNINGKLKFNLNPRKDGQSLRDYYVSSFMDFQSLDLTGFANLTDAQVKQGLDLLMFGEMPNNDGHKPALYATREKYVSAFNLPRFPNRDRQGESVCLTLSVTTRGIGFHLSRFVFLCGYNRTPKLNIYATYRAFLGLFEIKLKPNWLCTRIKPSETYRSSFVRTNPNLTSPIVISVPEQIKRIINAVGNITIGQRTFVMAVAKERLHENGKLIPEPQNLLISNLRRTVEALSDPETPLQRREHFEQNCPIPGAVWDNHLLANADEIIPPNYSADDLEVDILAWVECASDLKGRVEPAIAELTLNDGDAPGKRSAFMTVTMEHPMRVKPREVGQELAKYVPSFRPQCWLKARSFVWLTPEETLEGRMLLLGEWSKGETRPIYALRNPVVCSYDVVKEWNFDIVFGEAY